MPGYHKKQNFSCYCFSTLNQVRLSLVNKMLPYFTAILNEPFPNQVTFWANIHSEVWCSLLLLMTGQPWMRWNFINGGMWPKNLSFLSDRLNIITLKKFVYQYNWKLTKRHLKTVFQLTSCLWRSFLDGFKNAFGSEHSGLHGGVGALDVGHVHESGSTAGQAAARKCQLWNALVASFIQGSCSVAARNSRYWKP